MFKACEEQKRSDKSEIKCLIQPDVTHDKHSNIKKNPACRLGKSNLGKSSHTHTDEANHKRMLLHTEKWTTHTKKDRLRRATHRAWQTFSYDLLLGGEKQISDGIMKRQKRDEKKPGTPTSKCIFASRASVHTRPHSHMPVQTKREQPTKRKACISVCVCLCVQLSVSQTPAERGSNSNSHWPEN